MDFFGRQEQARKQTRKLVALFALAVISITLLLYVAAMTFFNLQESESQVSWWRPEILLAVSTLTLLVVGGGSAFKISQLRSGGAAVAQMLGGRPVSSNTDDRLERRLVNVVEEMSIAAGTPVPDVFVLDGEPGINAFAAGYSTGDAAVAVTRGCLEQLSRDELQGVIAHEFSHVFNGDMRLNVRLMGVLFGILCIAMAGFVLLRSVAYGAVGRRRSSNNKGGGVVPIIGMAIALIVIGYVGVFFARLIKAAVSRQREFLADASAVQFTRNPAGISGALKKIGGFTESSQIRNAHAEEASHMFFANGLSRFWMRMLATHPPLEDRITRIQPAFEQELAGRQPAAAAVAAAAGSGAAAAAGLAAGAAAQAAPAPAKAAAARSTTPEQLVEGVGEVRPDHVAYARALLEDLPLRLTAAAREPFSARCLVHALLLDDAPDVRKKQLEILQEQGDPATAHEANALNADAKDLARPSRLALVEMAIPALRGLSPDQFRTFSSNVKQLAEADAQITTFEYALQKILWRHLQRRFERIKPRRAAPLPALLPYAGVVLSALARGGHDDEDQARKAVADGAAVLGSDVRLELLPPDQCSLTQLDGALDRLDGSHPLVKRRILLACARAVSSDGVIEPEEVELLRAVADTLGCPMPPMV